MSYQISVPLQLGAGNAGVQLEAAIYNISGIQVGASQPSLFFEYNPGNYGWTGTIPDNHRGFIFFRGSGTGSGTLYAMTVINPQETEYADTKTSLISLNDPNISAIAVGVTGIRLQTDRFTFTGSSVNATGTFSAGDTATVLAIQTAVTGIRSQTDKMVFNGQYLNSSGIFESTINLNASGIRSQTDKLSFVNTNQLRASGAFEGANNQLLGILQTAITGIRNKTDILNFSGTLVNATGTFGSSDTATINAIQVAVTGIRLKTDLMTFQGNSIISTGTFSAVSNDTDNILAIKAKTDLLTFDEDSLAVTIITPEDNSPILVSNPTGNRRVIRFATGGSIHGGVS
jgi:hypothetical protein